MAVRTLTGALRVATGLDARVSAVCALVAALSFGALTAVPAATAHVHAISPGAARDSVALVMFEVPNESPTGSPTTELSVTLPDVSMARTETKPGWTVRLERDAAAGTVRSVTWTATGRTGGGGIGADEFGLFRITMKLPDAGTVQFPSAQRYADGTVVRWEQPPLPDGTEPRRPTPVLHLAPAAPEHSRQAAEHTAPSVSAQPGSEPPSDRAARLLGGGALLLGAIGLAVAIARPRT